MTLRKKGSNHFGRTNFALCPPPGDPCCPAGGQPGPCPRRRHRRARAPAPGPPGPPGGHRGPARQVRQVGDQGAQAGIVARRKKGEGGGGPACTPGRCWTPLSGPEGVHSPPAEIPKTPTVISHKKKILVSRVTRVAIVVNLYLFLSLLFYKAL